MATEIGGGNMDARSIESQEGPDNASHDGENVPFDGNMEGNCGGIFVQEFGVNERCAGNFF
jgi:hypothetical protein